MAKKERHSWEWEHKFKAVCRKCGLRRLAVPNPYGPMWVTQWEFPDGRYEYGKTPPCEPKKSKDAA